MRLKKISKTLWAMLTLTLSLSLFGCGTVKENKKIVTKDLSSYELDNYEKNADSLKSTNKLVNGEQIVIGFSLNTLREPIWKKHKESFVSKANELGAEVRVMQANNDDKVQLSQIDQLIAEGVNVLMVAPHDGVICAEVAEKAHKAGIKLIAYDGIIKNSDVDFYVSLNSYKVGEYQATELLKNVSSGNVAYVGGAPTDNNALIFRDESLKVLNEHKDTINLVMDKYTTDWNVEEAYSNIIQLLNKNHDIQGILCANDGTASAAIAALKNFSLDGKVPVTGLDADLAACQRVVEGKQLMTVYKPADKIAEKAAEICVQMAKGEQPEANNKMFNGKVNVPAYYIEPVIITKDNMMDTIIKDKYHEFEDVYKNIPQDQRPKQ